MALSTYGGLAAAITSWLERGDLDDQVPDMVRLAESQIERALRVREMQATVTGTFADGAADLPDDFLDLAAISLTTSPRRPLRYLPLGEFMALPSREETGTPLYVTYVGSEMLIAPIQADAPYELVYYQRLPALGTSQQTNWLLDKAPDLYLFAALCELEAFSQNDERIGLWQTRRDAALDELNGREQLLRARGAANRARRSPW